MALPITLISFAKHNRPRKRPLLKVPDMTSKQYDDARQAANDAFKVYAPIRDAYRAGKLSDADFLAAQKTYFAAEALFDAAYALEAANDE